MTRQTIKGRFITLEGSEGVGKTTNLAVIEQVLRERGVGLVVTREPGGTALGERIRQLLLHEATDDGSENASMVGTAELLLMFAARAQHVAQVIRPALERGDWGLSDRFTDATYAYQGSGRGLPMEDIASLETLVQGELRPDLTLYLDIDPKVAFARIADRQLDRIEREELAFFHRVREGYRARAAAEPLRFAVVDAAADQASVAADVRRVVSARVDAFVGPNER